MRYGGLQIIFFVPAMSEAAVRAAKVAPAAMSTEKGSNGSSMLPEGVDSALEALRAHGRGLAGE